MDSWLYIFVLCILFSKSSTQIIEQKYSNKEPVLEVHKKRPSSGSSVGLVDYTVMPYSTKYKFDIDCKNPDYVDESQISLPSLHYPDGTATSTYVEPQTVPCSQVLSADYINKWIPFNTESDTVKFQKRTGAVDFESVTDDFKYEETRDCCDSGKTCPTTDKCFGVPTTTCSFMIIHPVKNILLRKGRCNSLCQQVDCPLTCPDGTVNLKFYGLCLTFQLLVQTDICFLTCTKTHSLQVNMQDWTK
jgi:hypothetical protein